MRKILLISMLVLITGCVDLLSPIYYTDDYIVRIESDTYWEGNVGERYVSGYGTRTYTMYGPACWDLRKTTRTGLLRAFATYRNYYQGGDFPVWDDRATTSAYGSVRGCR